jgi:tetratricopeptide (TPR) repeat protein
MAVAELYVSLDRPDLALPLLDDWIRLHAGDAALGEGLNLRCWARGLANTLLGDALDDCRAAVRRDGPKPDYLDSLGLVQLRLGHYADAIAAYSQALTQQPDAAWSRYGRGLAKLRSGQTESAQADLAAARAIAPDIDARTARFGLAASRP